MTTPANEAERVAALHDLAILDTPPEDHFDAVCRTARRLFGVATALVTFVDIDRQWTKTPCAAVSGNLLREHSFCDHTIRTDAVMVVPDLRRDPRFADNPLVQGGDPIVFYAGAPLILASGHRVGSLCLIDRETRDFSAEDAAALTDLAAIVTAHLRLAEANGRIVRESAIRLAHENRIAQQHTELARRATDLSSAHHLLAMAEQIAGVGHWRVVLATGQPLWSEGIYRIAGLDPANPPPALSEAITLYHPDDRAKVATAIADAIAKKGDFAFEARHLRVGGSPRDVVVRGICERDADGEVVALFGTIVDLTESRRADAALRERTSQFRRLVDGVSDCAFVTLDRTGHVATWNSGAQRILGYPASAAIGRHFSRFYTRTDQDAHAPRISLATAAAEGRLKYQAWRVRQDGSQFFADVALDAIRDESGVVIGFAKITRDITERRAAERELRRSEDRYRGLADALPLAVWTMRLPDGAATYVNAGFTAYYGPIGPSRIARLSHNHPDDADRMEQAWWDARAAGRTFAVEGRLRRHDGVYRWHKIVMIPIGSPDPGRDAFASEEGSAAIVAKEGATTEGPAADFPASEPLEWLGTALDIDDIITAQQKLEETTDLLRIAQEAADAGTWDLDLIADTITLGAKSLRLFGMPGDTATRLSAEDWIAGVHPDDAPILREEARRAISTRTAFSAEYRLVTGADERWISTRGRVLYDSADMPYRMVGLHFDITERKAVEAALRAASAEAERASQAKSDFLAAMSHEIRTPLNSVLGYADLLLDAPHHTVEDRRRLELIQGSGAALLTVVNDILDFSKLEAGHLTLDPVVFPLAGLIEDTVAIVRGSALKSPVTIRCDLSADLPPFALGDASRLRQVLLNLLNNAVKFTPTGSVVLSVRHEGSTPAGEALRFAITDTGIGIAQEQQARLFLRFSQVDSSISRRFGGTGLGLAICHRLVAMMGGTIGVESREGAGSTFWFCLALPRAAAPPAVSLPPVPSPRERDATPGLPVARQVRLLVAEDVPVNQTLARAVLELAGHYVDVVGDGAEAVAAVAATAGGPDAYDLVLMDVQMPGMDGLSATRLIRALAPPANTVPIVAMTANVLPQQIALLRAAGMDDHIGKPFKRDALYAAVARWTCTAARDAEPDLPAELSPGAILDHAAFASFRETVGRARASALLAMLAEELVERFGKGAAGSVAEPDRSQLAYDAHAMVSAAGLLGFVGLSDLCREIETACRSGSDLDPLVRRLSAVRDGTLGTIKSLQDA